MRQVSLFTFGVFYLINVAFSQTNTTNNSTNLSNFSGFHDKIHQLPNVAADVMEEQQIFAGYLNVNTTKNLYYYFVESKRGATSVDPLLLFLTGGNYISGLSFAFGVGGPLKINSDMTITSNPYSWNRKANVLYLEATPGSGYSYDTDKNYKFNDQIVAEDTFKSLQQFYAKFPYMKQRKLIVLGQSDGGIYASALSKIIVDWNKQQHSPENQIELTTIAVANGYNKFSNFLYPTVIENNELEVILDKEIDGKPITSYKDTCQIVNEDGKWNGKFPDDLDSSCQKFHLEVGLAVQDNFFDRNVSIHDSSKECRCDWDRFEATLNETVNNYHQVGIQQPPPATESIFCLDNDAHIEYFNRKDVKQALFVPLEVNWANFRMQQELYDVIKQLPKNGVPVFEYDENRTNTSPIWKFLLSNGIRGVIYHGLDDILIPVVATTVFQETLNLSVTENRKNWSYPNGIDGKLTVGGSVVEYQNLTSIFVVGEGSIVGLNVPEKSQKIIEHYILQDHN